MLEIDALLGQAMPAVSAAVGAYGVGVLTKAESEAADTTVRLGQRVLARILRRSAQPAAIEAAVTDLAQAVEDPDALAALRLQIKKVLAGYPELAAELSALLPTGPTVHASGARSVAIDGDNSGIVATGDTSTNFLRR
ncbi:hypothetical protein ACFXJ5_33690 [Streptomyces sp. NPDC059373]